MVLNYFHNFICNVLLREILGIYGLTLIIKRELIYYDRNTSNIKYIHADFIGNLFMKGKEAYIEQTSEKKKKFKCRK